MRARTAALVVLPAVLGTILLGGSASARSPVAPPRLDAVLAPASFPAAPRAAKLDSRLADVAARAHELGATAAAGRADAIGLDRVGERVRVVVDGRGRSGTDAAVAAAGGTVEASYAGFVQALVPAAGLAALAADPAVGHVDAPVRPAVDALDGEEVASTGGALWRTWGYTGNGVKVAVIDAGFAGYRDAQASGEPPASNTAPPSRRSSTRSRRARSST
ncbi:MAG TPA: hypothetical protein VFT42_09305 [Solirubrobacteraceae bacterium]|nr:hypothetical protein [Solirubrobacteraceae bacterium]